MFCLVNMLFHIIFCFLIYMLFCLLQTSSLAQIMRIIQALMSDYADGFEFYESEAKANDSEKTDALEVI